MQKILTFCKRADFKKLVRITRNIDEKDRLRAILAYDDGRHGVSDIADILKISNSTIYNYINDYLKQNKVAHSHRGGSSSNLEVSQEIRLIRYLQATTYLTAKAICQYVFGKYQIKYTISGVTKWLERNDFVYKAPKLIPDKLDEEKHQQFIEYYQGLVAAASNNDIIMFMDSVHPKYQSQSVCGWMPNCETKTIAATNTQYRLHLNGAIDLSSMQIFTREHPTINAQSIISFCTDRESIYPNKSICLICDNGRSNKNKELAKYLENSKVIIHYSLNLNQIERLWNVIREHVTYNKVCSKFANFTAAIRHFFADTVHSIKDILYARINDNFEVIRHNPAQLSS